MANNPSVSIAAKVREVGVHSAIYGFGSIAQSAVQFVLIPVLTAALATAEFGAYSLIQIASTLAGCVFYLGITSALPRSYFDYADERDRRSVFTTAFLLLVAGAMAQVVLGELGGRWISRLLLRTDRYHVEVFWAFLGGALSFINTFFFAYLRFLRRSVASVMLSILALVGSVGVSLYLLHINSQDLTAPFKGIASAQLAVSIVFVLLYGRGAFTRFIMRREISVLLRYGVPIVFSSIASLAIDSADRIFIERMLSLRDVGVYSVGYKLGSTINTLAITPFVQIWNPMMIEYRAHGNIGDFFSRIVSYYFLVSTLILAAACLFVREVLPFLARSADYSAASPVILLVMAGYLLSGSTNIVAAGLIYERRVLRLAVVYYAIAIAKMGLNFYFIPHFGIIGAAVSTLLICALIPVVVYWQASRYFSIRFEDRRLLRILVIVALSLVFGLFIDVHFTVHIVAKAILFLLVLVALVVFCTERAERTHVLRLIGKPL